MVPKSVTQNFPVQKELFSINQITPRLFFVVLQETWFQSRFPCQRWRSCYCCGHRCTVIGEICPSVGAGLVVKGSDGRLSESQIQTHTQAVMPGYFRSSESTACGGTAAELRQQLRLVQLACFHKYLAVPSRPLGIRTDLSVLPSFLCYIFYSGFNTYTVSTDAEEESSVYTPTGATHPYCQTGSCSIDYMWQ